LLDKFGRLVSILNRDNDKNTIEIASEIEYLECFRVIKSAIRVTKDKRCIALDKPLWRRCFSPAGINPSLAWCMCKFAGLDYSSVIIDPFCGSGTIGITAGFEFGVKKVFMSDISEKSINTTIENLRQAGRLLRSKQLKKVKTSFKAFVSDIKNLNFGQNKFTHIITNPPYGLRSGKHLDNTKIYKTLACFASKYLDDSGLCILISQEKRLVLKVFNEFNLVDSFDVSSGGLHLKVWKFARFDTFK